MAQEDPNRLREWFEVARTQAPVLRRHLADFAAEARENPALLWKNRAVRYSAYGTGGLILIWVVGSVVSFFAPAPPASAKPLATSADFHVVCTRPDCGSHFVIHRDFGFHEFPVPCPKCSGETGMPARRCNSPTCRGRWVSPRAEGEHVFCPVCGGRFE